MVILVFEFRTLFRGGGWGVQNPLIGKSQFIKMPIQTKSSVRILNLGFVNAQLRDDDCKIRVFKSAA